MLDAINLRVARMALALYIGLGAIIARNVHLLSNTDIGRLHEEGRWTQAHARSDWRKRRGIAND